MILSFIAVVFVVSFMYYLSRDSHSYEIEGWLKKAVFFKGLIAGFSYLIISIEFYRLLPDKETIDVVFAGFIAIISSLLVTKTIVMLWNKVLQIRRAKSFREMSGIEQ